jgi:hypothetical protein
MIPAGSATITKAVLWIVAVEGKAMIRENAILGITNTTDVLLADSTSNNLADNNNLVFLDNAFYCAGNPGCIPISITSGNGGTNNNGISFIFVGTNIGDGTGGTGCMSGLGCMVNIDGTTNGGTPTQSLSNVIFDGLYIEGWKPPDWAASTAYTTGATIEPLVNNSATDIFKATTGGTSAGSEPNWGTSCATTCTDGSVTWTNLGINPTSHFIEAKNVRNLDIRGLTFNAGPTLTDCVFIDHASSSTLTGRVHFSGRDVGGRCLHTVENNITGYTSPAISDFDYTYPGDLAGAGGVIFDGEISTRAINQVAANRFAGSGTSPLTVSFPTPYASAPVCSVMDVSATPAIIAMSSFTSSGFTATGTAGHTLNWICIGNPN